MGIGGDCGIRKAPGGELFRGIHTLSLDSKGRLALPSKYRESLQAEADGQVVATIALDNRCLWLYPLSQWEALERQLVSYSSLNRKASHLQRLLIGHANECQLDGQGRVLLSTPLRKYANLDKNIVLVGVGGKFEIWDEETWDIRRNVWIEEMSLEDLAEPPDFSALKI